MNAEEFSVAVVEPEQVSSRCEGSTTVGDTDACLVADDNNVGVSANVSGSSNVSAGGNMSANAHKRQRVTRHT